MNKLKRVEEARSKMELDTRNEIARVQRECELEVNRKVIKIGELESLLQAAEKARADGEVALETSKLYENRANSKLEQAEARGADLKARLDDMSKQMQALGEALRASQGETEAARSRGAALEAERQRGTAAAGAELSQLRGQNQDLSGSLGRCKEDLAKRGAEVAAEARVSAERRSKIGELQAELERAAANVRFEKDLRSDRERDLQAGERRAAEAEAKTGLLSERLNAASAKVDLLKEDAAKLEAKLRLAERDASDDATRLRAEGAAREDALKQRTLRGMVPRNEGWVAWMGDLQFINQSTNQPTTAID